MTSEDLKKYKEKLSKLSKKEKKLRDLYLRKIAIGEIQGPLTGYPSIDKPWLKWHNEKNLLLDYPKTNVCDYFFQMANKENVLIEYYGKKYKREDIKKEVNKYICMFSNMGIKKDTTVSFIMLDVPELLFMWLALAKLGAKANVIKFDEGAERIKLMNKIGNAEYMFISEVPFIVDNVVQSIKDGTALKKIITVPVTNELSIKDTIRLLYNEGTKGKETKEEKVSGLKDYIDNFIKTKEDMKKIYLSNDKIISYKDFEKKYHFRINDKRAKVIKKGADKVSMIVYTGGTTGAPKGVELTNENIIASTHTLRYSEVGFDEGKSSLNILPPGPSYYIHAVYGMICCGVSVNMIFNFTLDEYPDLIAKYKPNIFLSGPILLKGIVDKDILDDASFVTGPMSGGDKLHLSEEKRINEYFHKRNSDAVVMQGYGESESCGAASVCKQNAYIIGSVGEPLIGIDVSVFDYDDKNTEKKYNEVGELCISGPTLMKGYKGDKEATDKVLLKHDDGRIWLHTDDLGYIDEDGRIFHCGRAKRMLTRSGAKVWLAALEDIIKQHDNVFDVCCVKMNDEKEREVPVANIVLKDYSLASQTFKEINEMIKNCQPLTYIPKYYVLRNEIPITKVNNKVDFKQMEEENILDSNNFDINENIVKSKSLILETRE